MADDAGSLVVLRLSRSTIKQEQFAAERNLVEAEIVGLVGGDLAVGSDQPVHRALNVAVVRGISAVGPERGEAGEQDVLVVSPVNYLVVSADDLTVGPACHHRVGHPLRPRLLGGGI